jgi:hypothetical protein
MLLEHLFDGELTYRAGMAPLAEHSEGQLIGSGDGASMASGCGGVLRWTLFERPASWPIGYLRPIQDRITTPAITRGRPRWKGST